MRLLKSLWFLPFAGVVPVVVVLAQQSPQPPTCEQVFKDIQVFKGVPASDLIPAMEFMAASLKVTCTGCHTANDYAANTRAKDDARKMVLMQRDINEKWFNGKLEVTCMSCHNGKDHPASFPLPSNVTLRHERAGAGVDPKSLFEKHIAAVGAAPASITLTGIMEAPNDETHKMETTPLELIQARDGRFRLVAGQRKFGSDGKGVWYGSFPVTDEPAAILGRIGRSWRGAEAFAGLERTSISGKESLGKMWTLVVRASRPSTTSTEELYFDEKSNLLVRLVNVKRSSLGQVISAIDYSNFKAFGAARVPMKVVVSFANGDTWTMTFKSAKVDDQITDSLFQKGG
jgi:photosynthetic reaction center cytochrome c subunit